MAAAPPLRDRLSFLHRLPILLKGTSDDDIPCPGYLFEEIASILLCTWGGESRQQGPCAVPGLLGLPVGINGTSIMVTRCGQGLKAVMPMARSPGALAYRRRPAVGARREHGRGSWQEEGGFHSSPGQLAPSLMEHTPEISHESLGSSQCLLEYLLSRLDSSSGHVKLKVLKILLYLCGHGSSSFLLILKRNSAFIQEATVFSGPPDPLHGNSLYQKVRAAAQDLGSTLFSDAALPLPAPQPPRGLASAGMGSQSRPQSVLQGFGYSKERGQAGSAGEAFLSTIQRAAEVVANVVRSGPETPGAQKSLLRGDTYQPAMTPCISHGLHSPGNLHPRAMPSARATRHQPGQAGGGWEELSSSPGSQNSSQDSDLSRASDSGSRSGSDSHSGAGREPGDLAEGPEAVAPSDYQQELSLVRTLIQGPRAFLSREEAQRFVKECGLLNCEAVLGLLLDHLGGARELEQMRALSAVASLGCADLLSPERVLLLARQRLQELSAGSPGPVTSKATKILRHFEASCAQRPPAPRPCAQPGPAAVLPGPSDLLTDPLPPAGGQASLQPLSSTPALPRGAAPTPVPGACPFLVPGDTGGAESSPAGSREQGAGPEQEPRDTDASRGGPGRCPQGRGSLFEGMELVARPRLVEAPRPAPRPPSQSAAASEPGSEPSAFPFLNL